MTQIMGTKLLRTLGGYAEQPPPVWLMRQAGRYLPEYRVLRAKAGAFWTMCMTPELAAAVSLQPVERFGLDAAIIFSDILVVPYALGLGVSFESEGGPRLSGFHSAEDLEIDAGRWRSRLSPCYEALRQVRSRLDRSVALLGFAGAPWTLATYMAEGGGSADQRAAKLWGYRRPSEFSALLGRIGDCVARHLIEQLAAGADAVQLFDSWAGGLPPDRFAEWVVAPTRAVVAKVRNTYPDARIIGFPRAATLAGYELYARETGVTAISLDTAVPLDWAVDRIAPDVIVQGNIDPVVLLAGGDALEDAVRGAMKAMKQRPYIINLGHGVLPDTPPEHVAQLVELVRTRS